MLEQAMTAVHEFHEKMGLEGGDTALSTDHNAPVIDAGTSLVSMSRALQEYVDDPDRRYRRAHLLLEEVGELLIAMGKGNAVDTLDALADSAYVLLGTAIALDMPLPMAFVEVHRSNMTKQKMPNDPFKARLRDKGPNYTPPDIEACLRYRDIKQESGHRAWYDAQVVELSDLSMCDAELIRKTVNLMSWDEEWHTKVRSALKPIADEWDTEQRARQDA